jgi:hypothetical protein
VEYASPFHRFLNLFESSRSDLPFFFVQVVDCAEGTLRQFVSQPSGGRRLALTRLSKIFITHMHGSYDSLHPILNSLTSVPRSGPRHGHCASHAKCAPSSNLCNSTAGKITHLFLLFYFYVLKKHTTDGRNVSRSMAQQACASSSARSSK